MYVGESKIKRTTTWCRHYSHIGEATNFHKLHLEFHQREAVNLDAIPDHLQSEEQYRDLVLVVESKEC